MPPHMQGYLPAPRFIAESVTDAGQHTGLHDVALAWVHHTPPCHESRMSDCAAGLLARNISRPGAFTRKTPAECAVAWLVDLTDRVRLRTACLLDGPSSNFLGWHAPRVSPAIGEKPVVFHIMSCNAAGNCCTTGRVGIVTDAGGCFRLSARRIDPPSDGVAALDAPCIVLQFDHELAQHRWR